MNTEHINSFLIAITIIACVFFITQCTMESTAMYEVRENRNEFERCIDACPLDGWSNRDELCLRHCYKIGECESE